MPWVESREDVMKSKVLLTISILISNRPDTVRKCLDSIQPLLQAVSSELILTDTGCGDEVRGMIEEYTSHIIDFVWCRDFAKARNAGLRQAKGKWFLFLDDDEWFEDTTEIIRFFTSGEFKKYGLGVYLQRNYMDKMGSVFSDLPVARMVRLDPGVEFMYSIHEIFNCVPGPVKKFSAFVHHYGYAYDTPEEAKAHAMRNIELLQVEHKAHPGNMKHTLQLAQEYNSIDDWEKSLELSLEAVKIAKTRPIEMEFCRDSMYANAIEAYMHLHREQEAIETGEKYLAEEKLDPLASAMIAGLLAELYQAKGELEKCLEMADFYDKVYKDYSKDMEPFMGYVTTITSDCFDQRKRSIALGAGVRAAIALGKADRALEWFHRLDLEEDKIFVSNEMVRDILKKVAKVNAEGEGTEAEKAALVEMCNTFLKRKEMEDFVAQTILDTLETGEELSAFADLKSDLWEFAMARLLKGQEYEKNVLTVWKHMEESMPYIRKYRVMEVLESTGCEIGQVLSGIPFYVWSKALSVTLRGGSDEAQWWRKWLELLPTSEELKWLEYRRMVLYRRLDRVDESGQEPAADQEIWEYGDVTAALCERIYRKEVLEEEREILMPEYQAGLLIRDLQSAMEEKRYNEAVELIRQMKELMPQFVSAMRPLLIQIQAQAREEETRQNAVANELQMLGMQIKLKIRQLMQAGQTKDALAVAEQLAVMLPGDDELQQLIRRLRQQ